MLIRTLSYPGVRRNGWLRIGLSGHQPGVGEHYISTGSLYLCATAFLPLGLPPDDPFWAQPPRPWTARLAWSGAPFPIDHALQPDRCSRRHLRRLIGGAKDDVAPRRPESDD